MGNSCLCLKSNNPGKYLQPNPNMKKQDLSLKIVKIKLPQNIPKMANEQISNPYPQLADNQLIKYSQRSKKDLFTETTLRISKTQSPCSDSQNISAPLSRNSKKFQAIQKQQQVEKVKKISSVVEKNKQARPVQDLKRSKAQLNNKQSEQSDTESSGNRSSIKMKRSILAIQKVSKLAFQLPSFFQKCPLCNKIFKEQFKPNLLDCGHFLCSQCCGTEFYCPMLQCDEPLSIRKTGYWWPKQIIQNQNQKNCYCFKVRPFTQNQIFLKVKNGNKLFGQIMEQDPQISGFISRSKAVNIQVIMNAKTISYASLKNRSVNDLASQYQLINYTNVSRRANQISFTDKSLGGFQYEYLRKQSLMQQGLDYIQF